MRFDETSARYAEFGEFFVGRLIADPSATSSRAARSPTWSAV